MVERPKLYTFRCHTLCNTPPHAHDELFGMSLDETRGGLPILAGRRLDDEVRESAMRGRMKVKFRLFNNQDWRFDASCAVGEMLYDDG